MLNSRHTVRYCKTLIIFKKHVFWYHITVFYHVEWHSIIRKVCWLHNALADHGLRTAVMQCVQTDTHTHTHTVSSTCQKSGSLYQCELHCSVLGRPLSQLQSVPAHNDFSFIAVNSINRYVKIIIKLSNVIIHIQTGIYLDLSLRVQVEHMRKICVHWCIVNSSTFYIRGLLIKLV
jgi:hypothetical protein